MRSRAPALLLASILTLVFAPAAAAAAKAEPANIAPYKVVVDNADEAGILADIGYDMHESGYDNGDTSSQELAVYLSPTEAATLEARGVDTTAVPIEAPQAKSLAKGDSPNPYFNVWRSYSEPGGIADEMRATAAANPDVMKLETLGVTELGKPILAIKMTENARNTPDGARPALLFSAINHAREWVAAEQGRRLPVWFAENKNEPKIRDILRKTELWFLPIQNVDGYDFTFTCGLGADAGPVRLPRPHRRTTTASGARRSATTTPTASAATARTASTRTATTRPSAPSTRRARATASARAPTAARIRCRSPATWPSTGSSAGSSSTATSTTTPTASCC